MQAAALSLVLLGLLDHLAGVLLDSIVGSLELLLQLAQMLHVLQVSCTARSPRSYTLMGPLVFLGLFLLAKAVHACKPRLYRGLRLYLPPADRMLPFRVITRQMVGRNVDVSFTKAS